MLQGTQLGWEEVGKSPPQKGCFSMQLTMEAEILEGKEQNKGGRRGEQDGRKGPSKESTMKGSFEKGEGLIFQE